MERLRVHFPTLTIAPSSFAGISRISTARDASACHFLALPFVDESRGGKLRVLR